MDPIARLITVLLPQQAHFDHLAVGVVDFRAKSIKTYGHQDIWFDLASVTKVLGNAAAYALRPEALDPERRLLLEHRAGLPAWGLVTRDGWRDQIRSYALRESPTLYSDFSAMRASLEFHRVTGQEVPAVAKSIWDSDVCFWRDLPATAVTVKTGERAYRPIRGEVHDPNAWVIKDWCGHAGLFGTVRGVCQTLLNLDREAQIISGVQRELAQGHAHRFVLGWDRVENPAQTLAGKGCSKFTFGHLGFTGTSVWIDAEKQRGHVILSNATRDGWYCKEGLNEFRRLCGELIWSRA